MICPIVTVDSPHAAVLHMHAYAVTCFSQTLCNIVDDMWDSMYAAQGVGLAAPQIGVDLAVAVIDISFKEDAKAKIVLINPEISYASDYMVTESEGCLSMPGLRWPIKRPQLTRVDAQKLDGSPFTIEGKGLLARALLHEIDHLNGKLCNRLAPRGEDCRGAQ